MNYYDYFNQIHECNIVLNNNIIIYNKIKYILNDEYSKLFKSVMFTDFKIYTTTDETASTKNIFVKFIHKLFKNKKGEIAEGFGVTDPNLTINNEINLIKILNKFDRSKNKEMDNIITYLGCICSPLEIGIVSAYLLGYRTLYDYNIFERTDDDKDKILF